MRQISTLRGRLVAGSLGVNALLLLALGAGLWLTVRTVQSQEVSSTLQLSAAQLAAAVDVRGATVLVPTDDAAAVTTRGVFGWVVDRQGVVQARIGGVPAGLPPLPVLGVLYDAHLADGTPVRLYRRALSADSDVNAGGLSLLVGLSLLPLERTAATISVILGVSLPLALALAAGAGWIVAGRALAPLAAIAAQAERIDRQNLTERVALSAPPTEVGRLAATFNAMLDRLAAAFAHEQRFTADASHELRTPLGLLKTQISLALSRPRSVATLTAMLRAMDTDLNRLIRLVERMLLLARLDSDAHTPGPVDLAGLLAGLVARRQESTGHDTVAMTWNGPESAWVAGDGDHLVQLFLNLLDNAVAWTPAGGQVAVTLAAADAGWTVTVADSGPGIAADHLPHLFERFYRVDPARARATGGTGLGLAIAQALAGEHGGCITVTSTPGFGSRFMVWLPQLEPNGTPKGATGSA